MSTTLRASREKGKNELQIPLIKVTATKASAIKKKKALESPGRHLSCVLNSGRFHDGERESKGGRREG